MKTTGAKESVMCPYCGNKMKAATIAVNTLGFVYSYVCDRCGSRSPIEDNTTDAFNKASNITCLSETTSNKDEDILKKLREEYMRGFDAGYKEGRARGHGFSYD